MFIVSGARRPGASSPGGSSAGMNEPATPQDDFARGFEAAFARLQVLIEGVCAARTEWPVKVAAAIDAVLSFAAADPGAVQLLTNEALAHGVDGIARHERLIAYLCEGLAPGREQRAENDRLPEITERALASGVVMMVAERVDRGRAGELPAIAGEVIQFALTPYLGAEEATRVGAAPRPLDLGLS
jgi:hypothetical protein